MSVYLAFRIFLVEKYDPSTWCSEIKCGDNYFFLLAMFSFCFNMVHVKFAL